MSPQLLSQFEKEVKEARRVNFYVNRDTLIALLSYVRVLEANSSEKLLNEQHRIKAKVREMAEILWPPK